MNRRLSSTLLVVGALLGGWACDDDTASTPDQPVEDAEPDTGLPEMDAEVVDKPDPDAAPPAPDMAVVDAAEIPEVAVAVETRLGAEVTAAGVPNRVTCVALGADGGVIADVATRIEIRPAEGWEADAEEPGVYTGRAAGAYRVTCTAPQEGLRDETPSRWEVEPGPAVRIRAEVEPPLIEAGGAAEVTCSAVDAQGNPVDASGAIVTIAPESPGVSVDGRFIDATTAGRYRVACNLDGAAIDGEGRLDVTPGLPANLVAQLVPDEPVYSVGAIIGYPATVTDIYGNVVDAAPVVWTVEPDMPGFGAGRYVAVDEGRYTLGVRVDGPTFDEQELADQAEIVVDAGGPAIRCEGIADGSAIELRGPVTVEGQVADIAGLAAFEVDGAAVEVGGDGRFAVEVQPAWGLNVHTLVARDGFGNETSTFCAYFAAPSYLAEDALLFDGVALHLTQAAVDDGTPNNPISSLADLLRRVLDSPELISTIDGVLRAQNPIVPNDCRLRLPIIGCTVRFGAEYRGLEVRGPNDLQTTLLNGGIRFRATLRNVRVSVRTLGTVSVGGAVTVSDITVDLTFNVGLNNGRPSVSLRGVNEVRVGGIDLDIDGLGGIFDGAVDLVFSAFDGLVRNELVNALRGFLEGELDALLSGILDGLDLASLGLGFEVPTFDGSPPINLALGVELDQVNVNAQRLRVGISTRVDGDTRQPAPSAGVPMVEPPARVQLDPAGSVAGAISLGLVNQVLHRLWRASFFTFPDAGALIGGLPEGTTIGLDVRLPPAVEGIGDRRVRLHLGPAVATVAYPGLFDEPLRIRLAAKVTAGVDLVNGTELVFGGADGIVIESLDLVIDQLALAAGARESIERDLTRIIQAVADQALNDLLPNIPIPDFALPDDLVQYGVPAGTRLGLRDAALSGNRTHFILDGRFGE